MDISVGAMDISVGAGKMTVMWSHCGIVCETSSWTSYAKSYGGNSTHDCVDHQIELSHLVLHVYIWKGWRIGWIYRVHWIFLSVLYGVVHKKKKWKSWILKKVFELCENRLAVW